MQAKKWDLISVASIPLIMTLGNSMLIPVLPQISRELGISNLQVSMLITVYAVVAIVLIPVAGYLSDQYGRKKVIVPSLILAGIGGAIAGLAGLLWEQSAYMLILAGRFLQGIGAAGAFPIVIPLVGDMFQSEDEISKGLGVVETSNTFGKVLSPILGSALAAVTWVLPFLSIPVFCLISLLLVMFLVKAPQQKKPKVKLGDFLHSVRDVFKQKGRWLYAIFIVGGICMFEVFGVLFYLSSMLEDRFGIDGVTKGLILAIPLGALCLASFIVGKIIGKSKARMKWISFSGMLLLSVSVLSIGWFPGIVYIIGALVVAGVGIGAVLPCLDALITEGIEKEQRGTVTSFYSSMRFIGVSLGPPAVSLLMNASHRLLFMTVAGTGAAGALLTLLAIRPQAGGGANKNNNRRSGIKLFVPMRRPAR